MTDTVRTLHRAADMKLEETHARRNVDLTQVLDFVDTMTASRLTTPLTRAIKRLSRRTGLNTLLIPHRPGAAVSLYLHKVQRRPTGLWGEPALSVESFEEQVAYISTHFRPLALSRLATLLREGRPIPERSVVVTFDDGYRNNLRLAAPVLQRYGVPATLFVATGYIGTDRWMWGYELEEMFLHESPARIGEASGQAQFRELCRLGLSRRNTALACVQLLKMLPDGEKDRVMERLRRVVPVEVDDENRFLSWDEVRQIRSMGVEIGAHTVNHPLLNRLPLADAEREMVESKERLEKELDEPVRLFAYPNGNTTPELEEIAERHFDAAVTTEAGVITAASSRFAIPRIPGPNTDVDLGYELARNLFVADPHQYFGG